MAIHRAVGNRDRNANHTERTTLVREMDDIFGAVRRLFVDRDGGDR